MADYDPITLRAIDGGNAVFFEYTVPFRIGMYSKQDMEETYILAQTAAKPDPFAFTVQYYCYSEAAQFPGYLGNEIENLCGLEDTKQFY